MNWERVDLAMLIFAALICAFAIFMIIWLPLHNEGCAKGTTPVQTGEVWAGKFFVPTYTCVEVTYK